MLNSLQTAFQAARAALTPVATSSSFLDTGMLTPDEFVTAGDHLCNQMRLWRWARSEPGYAKEYLPPDRQFLVLKGAICHQRAREIEGEGVTETAEDGDWITSGGPAPTEDDYADLDAEEQESEGDEYIDPAVAAITGADTSTVRTDVTGRRMYTLAIVYDKYYRTPRVYLQGSTVAGVVMSPDQMMEDIVQDYAGKTATIERHPHLPSAGVYVSIHPCRHAATMQRLLQACIGAEAPTVASYMTYFLKFITSMIPTIEYDYTPSASIGR